MLDTRSKKNLSKIKLLFKEQHTLMLLLKEFRDGIMICDEEGVVLHVNDSLKSLLHLKNDVLGQRAVQIIRDDQFTFMMNSVLTTGTSFVEEIEISIASSIQKTIEMHLVPIFIPTQQSPYRKEEPEKDVNGCVVIFHDITDIRQTEKMRRDFVANVSHELRTPLSAIEGYSETLLEGALEDETVCRDFVNVIYKHSLRLSQLVEDLLDLSKLESPDFRLAFVPISLTRLMQKVYPLIHSKALEKEINIQIDFGENLPDVLGDFSSLEQVFTNLLDNAIKYTPVNGQVSVAAFVNDKGAVQVDIRDTGIGIEPKHLHRVFERFYRVDKARSRDLGGTGLGLAIVKHIIQLHGGEIWVSSVPNQGSTFSFTLERKN